MKVSFHWMGHFSLNHDYEKMTKKILRKVPMEKHPAQISMEESFPLNVQLGASNEAVQIPAKCFNIGFLCGIGKTHRIHGTNGIFTYIYQKNQPNVGKYISPMDPMGIGPISLFHPFRNCKNYGKNTLDQWIAIHGSPPNIGATSWNIFKQCMSTLDDLYTTLAVSCFQGSTLVTTGIEMK